jgi:hypothetical protein
LFVTNDYLSPRYALFSGVVQLDATPDPGR